MPYPVLLWDEQHGEAACTGCMACVNYCPTVCITATVARNERFGNGSPRKTLATAFTVDLPKCIQCGICVDVCKYDAITLGYGGPATAAEYPEGLADMESLLELGRRSGEKASRSPAEEKPPVAELLAAAYEKLPAASTADGARRARSRLRNTQPIKFDLDRKDSSGR